jgi:hypothetical protein
MITSPALMPAMPTGELGSTASTSAPPTCGKLSAAASPGLTSSICMPKV